MKYIDFYCVKTQVLAQKTLDTISIKKNPYTLKLHSLNVICLLDAPNDSFIVDGIICKHICLIFCIVKVYYLTPVCD